MQHKFEQELEQQQDVERNLGKLCKQGEPLKQNSGWLKLKAQGSSRTSFHNVPSHSFLTPTFILPEAHSQLRTTLAEEQDHADAMLGKFPNIY